MIMDESRFRRFELGQSRGIPVGRIDIIGEPRLGFPHGDRPRPDPQLQKIGEDVPASDAHPRTGSQEKCDRSHDRHRKGKLLPLE